MILTLPTATREGTFVFGRRERYLEERCNLSSVTKGQQAIRDLFRVSRDAVGAYGGSLRNS